MNDWAQDAVFYHIFPLGCLGAPERNPFAGAPVDRLEDLAGWIDYLADLGVDALLLGPVFESTAHGYDTADYFRVDRRLGDCATLADFSRKLHRRGIRLVLDGVFHHTGRDFWAFRDIREKGRASTYCDWYHLDFARGSPYGDPFHYQGWTGNYDLVKLNQNNPAVREHLFAAVSSWIERFEIDGLRLDAADALDLDFQRDLAAHCRALRPDFWLMGEVVHGDYRRWACAGGLAATTNYEAYKGLWSSHNDRNYFEISYSLKRQSGPDGIYRGLALFTFADNHDVDRVASVLKEPAHLYPLYVLLLTMPGVPAIYYGSETGIQGRKAPATDAPLRPALDSASMIRHAPHPELRQVIKNLIGLRHRHIALRRGDIAELAVANEQFAFIRRHPTGSVIVAVNAADRSVEVPLRIPGIPRARLVDALNAGEAFRVVDGRCTLPLRPCWARILMVE
ncbi:MAG TPA: alpha-amylase family glycosyl hydrolase [Candidatus Binataceae bacterium]